MRTLNLTLSLLILAATAHADVSDSGNLTIGGQGVIAGTMTVQGNAFSVGGSTFTVLAGTVNVGGLLRVSAAGIQWNDGKVSTTTSSGGGSSGDFTNLVTVSSGIYVTAPALSTQPANTLTSASFDKGWVVYNSTPTTPQIYRSMNVAGLLDNGVGLITVVWNTRFEQQDYVTTCTAYRTDVTNNAACNVYAQGDAINGYYSPNSVAIITSNFSGTQVDMKTFVRAIGKQ